MRITHVVGTRPNFVKVGPVIDGLRPYGQMEQLLVHTGQHYDADMSQVFFDQLGLPRPDVNLGVGSASHAVQTARIMIAFEGTVLEQRPDLVLVYGDVNSTVAAALVCAKLGVPLGHVEAGLRSFDRRMPEETNRLLTDRVADLLFTPSVDGDENLLREGVDPDRIHRVGNVMIDTLVRLLPQASAHWDDLRARLGLGRYGLVTLHRPSNVDDPATLASIMAALDEIGRDLPLVFPMHPRTRQRLEGLRIGVNEARVQITEPLGYLDFLALQRHAALVITDSGGVQEETTYLGVPCLTMRENTERPVTVTVGTNALVGGNLDCLCEEVQRVLRGQGKRGAVPPLWDGRAGARIATVVGEM